MSDPESESESEPDSNALAISNLIQSYEDNITNRANSVSKFELKQWTVKELTGVLDQLTPRPKRGGNNEPCGPDYNRHSPALNWLQIPVWSIFLIGSGWLVAMQLYAAIYLIVKGRFKAVWNELPVPTILLFNWTSCMFSWVKAPLSMIKRSVEQNAALCVNMNGRFAIKTEGYSVLSHVWAETCGWNTKTDWGPVEPAVRKQGIPYDHFRKFFDRCESEWLWVDIIAMPEIFEDMTAVQKSETEELRTGVINSLHNIYTKADKVVCLDGLLLRLHTGSMMDVAVILCLGRWILRLWPFTETKLAKRVVLKTEDSSFDLDTILEFLYKTIHNEDHRYFVIFNLLAPLRPVPIGQKNWVSSPLRPNILDRILFVDVYSGTYNRSCDVDIDQARALFPVLKLQWKAGWTLQQGLRHIADQNPEEQDILQKYCERHDIEFSLPNS